MALGSIVNVLDFALTPLLKLPPFWAIAVISLILSLVITIIYKYVTNQKELKRLREETKTLQTDMKAAQGDMQKMTALNQRLLSNTSEQMKHTFKSYIFTFIPAILILGWLQAHMVYYPILPGESFTTTMIFKEGAALGNVTLNATGLEMISPATQEISNNQVVWKLSGNAGTYALEYTYGKEAYERTVIISKEWKYANEAPNKGITQTSSAAKLTVDLKQIKPLIIPIVGWQFNWFWTYFILTMLFTFPIRKVLNVY
jgi:uncharacterized membrane protein (DUF106 family)